jgi:mRNA interferase MazF
MMRGDIVTIADRGGEFTGKPRPAIVLQSNLFADAPTVAVVPVTSQPTDAPLLRVPLGPNERTGLAAPSWVQIELLTTVRRRRVGERIGCADDATMLAINRALAVFLGLA